MIINDATKLGSGGSNLVLETAGKVYIKVADRFYELDFKNQGTNTRTISTSTPTEPPEIDMSQYVTKKYLKSTLSNYITQRGWEDVKETKEMLENALLDGFTESINPITIETMQLIVGTESLQFDFIEGKLNGTVRGAGFELMSGNQLRCPDNWIKHLSLDGPKSVRPETPIQYYSRWHVINTSEDSDGNTYLEMPEEDLSYYVYIRAPKYINPSTQQPYTDEYIEENIDLDPKGSGIATYLVSRTAFELETNNDPGYYYFLVAIVTSKSNGFRSIGYVNGFTEILPGQITAYIFKTREGDQFLDFLNKQFHIGFPATPGELETEGTISNGSYMHWDTHNGLVIKGKISVIGGDLKDVLDNLQKQIDDEIQAWFSDDPYNTNDPTYPGKHCIPTIYTWPANEWTEQQQSSIDPETGDEVIIITRESTEKEHVGDLYYISEGDYKGQVYRFRKSQTPGVYEWVLVEDNPLAIALALAQENQNKIRKLVNDGIISPIEIGGIREELYFVTSDYADLYKQSDLLGWTDSQDPSYSFYANYADSKILYENWLSKILYAYDNEVAAVTDENKNVSLEGCRNYWSSVLTDTFSNAMSSYYSTRTILCQALSTAVHTQISSLDYLKAAIKGATDIQGGLVLTNLLAMRNLSGETQGSITAGINGIILDSSNYTDIAAWYGGEMEDKAAYYDWDDSSKTWVLKSGHIDPGTIAKTVLRHNGSGYFAGGNIWWGSDGSGRIPGVSWSNSGVVTLDPDSRIGSTGKTLGNMGDFFELVSDDSSGTTKYYVHLKNQYTLDNTTYQIQGLYSDGFVSAGGINSSGGSGGGIVTQIWKSTSDLDRTFSPSDNDVFNAYVIKYLHTRILTLENTSGIVTSVANLTGAISESQLAAALGTGQVASDNAHLIKGGSVYSYFIDSASGSEKLKSSLIPVGSSSGKGIVQVDGSSIRAINGVISGFAGVGLDGLTAPNKIVIHTNDISTSNMDADAIYLKVELEN